MIDQNQIKKVIPHREPFLLIDEIETFEIGIHGVGYKTLTGEEDFFKGHFPGNPVMPGVLMIEALAQLGAFVILQRPEFEGKLAMFAGIQNVRFKRVVRPGDRLRLEATIDRFIRNLGTAKVVATVDGQVACKGETMFALVDA